jgi:hypothetical protein
MWTQPEFAEVIVRHYDLILSLGFWSLCILIYLELSNKIRVRRARVEACKPRRKIRRNPARPARR